MPKKRRTTFSTIKRVASLPVDTQKNLDEWGDKEDASNLERGLLSLPVELTTEILDYFPAIGPYTAIRDGDGSTDPVLPEFYLVRTDILRALSQVCIDYRRAFLPLLWDSLNVCFTKRMASSEWTSAFYKHVGEALVRKCDGLSANPNLASYIGTVRVVITRYQSALVIPNFSIFLSSLQNLHTLHILHAHTQMTTAIKNGFQGVVLSRIRTLIIPGYCHEILKCCPRVTKVWCNRDDGSKLVTVIAKYCKEVQEMRGFLAEEKLVKRIIKAAPNLRVLDMDHRNFQPMVDAFPSFKNINTIIIKASKSGIDQSSMDLNKCIEATKRRFKDLAPSKERRYIRIWHKSNDGDFLRYFGIQDKSDTNSYVRGYYTEVPDY